MNKKVNSLFAVLLVLSFVLGACAAPTATPVPPTPVPPTATAVPPTATPEPTTIPVVEAIDYQTLFAELVASIPSDKGYGTITAVKLNEELVENAPFLLDVREVSEIEASGYIEGTEHLAVREVLANLDKLPAKDVPIVVYCASGHRGGFVFAALKLLGWTNVRNLAGGLGAWTKAGLPVVTGSVPPAPEAGTAAEVDPQLHTELNAYFTALPDNFNSIKAADLNAKLVEEDIFLLDIRRADEFDANGYIEGAVNIPLEELFSRLGELPTTDTKIVVYCVSGHRGSVAAMGLSMLGYENVLNLGGGLNAWKGAQLPVVGWVDWAFVWTDFLTNIPEGFYSISATGLNEKLAETAPFILDVREVSELEANGYIEGAVNIPVRDVFKNLDKLPAQDQPIVVYCGSGHRGAFVLAGLRFLGYTNVVNLGGGLGAWIKAELPVVTGSLPEAPTTGTAPAVDATRLAQLDTFLTGLPEGFYSIKAADLNAQLAETAKPFVLDVRTAEEITADGYIEGSVLIPINEVMGRLAELPADKAAPIVVLCKSGHRGALALMALRMNGYTNILNLAGGMNAWIAAELPVVK